MKKVIVRYLLKNSPHTFETVATENEAKELIRKWRDGGYGVAKISGYDREQNRHWAVDTNEVSCILTIDMEDMLRMQQQSNQGQPSKPTNPYYGAPPSRS